MSAELCWMVTGGVPAKPSFFFRREWATVVTPPLLVLFCLISMVYVFDFYGFWLNLMVFVFRHKAYLLSPYGNTHTNSFYFHKFIVCVCRFVVVHFHLMALGLDLRVHICRNEAKKCRAKEKTDENPITAHWISYSNDKANQKEENWSFA